MLLEKLKIFSNLPITKQIAGSRRRLSHAVELLDWTFENYMISERVLELIQLFRRY